MTAVIYARYSSDSQREASIEGQQLFENILHHIFRIGGAAAVVHGGSEHRVTVSLHGQRKNLVSGQLSHSSMLL